MGAKPGDFEYDLLLSAITYPINMKLFLNQLHALIKDNCREKN